MLVGGQFEISFKQIFRFACCLIYVGCQHIKIYKVMKNQELKDTSQTQLCNWCEKPMPFDSKPKNSVCLICYKLLINAGISEEEIYGKNEAPTKIQLAKNRLTQI